MQRHESEENSDMLDERVRLLLEELDKDEQQIIIKSNDSKSPRAEVSTSSSKQIVQDSKTLQSVERMKREVTACMARVEDAKVALSTEEDRLRMLRSRPSSMSGRDRLLIRQEEEVAKAWKTLGAAEHDHDIAELALSRILTVSEGACHRVARNRCNALQSASRRQAEEHSRGVLQMSRTAHAQKSALARKAAEHEKILEQDKNAMMYHHSAQLRLQSSQKYQKEQTRAMDEMHEEKIMHYAQKLLKLKSSMEAIGNEICGQNEAKRKKRESIEQERQKCKHDLLSQGLNPYEVFRLQDEGNNASVMKCHAGAARALHEDKILHRIVHGH
eukprot:gnl/MRDRNA2_/MRDRNA2_96310_c0_seq1.p1 gnl/MRDRNA2_/MRDRNA2_96310_c0~~gnl/MRDRNA2_/MRDRNA2_96310_c0_seq1.p1  ORF type:complete len:330 (+),score=87.48 gnl/MRDRNA2_/MRDRNA2_96310_c0_seq1:86-1075(+)